MTVKPPAFYRKLRQDHPGFFDGWDAAGTAVRGAGPLDEKTAHLLQLVAAAAVRSEGAVHSHVRRALDLGTTAAEIQHALMLIAPTVGFPTVIAALSWAGDILESSGGTGRLAASARRKKQNSRHV